MADLMLETFILKNECKVAETAQYNAYAPLQSLTVP